MLNIYRVNKMKEKKICVFILFCFLFNVWFYLIKQIKVLILNVIVMQLINFLESVIVDYYFYLFIFKRYQVKIMGYLDKIILKSQDFFNWIFR